MFRPMFRYTHALVGSLLRVEAARSVIDALTLSRNATNELRDAGRKALSQACQVLDGSRSASYAAALQQLAQRGDASLDEDLLAAVQAALDGGSNYRTSSALVYNASHSDLIYLPPEAADVPSLVGDLVEWLADAWDQLPAVLLAGITLQELLLIQPFEQVSSAAARLAAGIVLWRKGYGFNGYASVETRFAADPDAYDAATQTSHSGVYSNTPDMTAWLEYYAESLALAGQAVAAEVQARFEAAHRPRIDGGPPPPLVLRDRQRQALEHMLANGAIRSGEYQRLAKIVPDTARRDFDELIDKGLIEVRGVGRGTHYVLTSLGIEEAGRRGAAPAAAAEG